MCLAIPGRVVSWIDRDPLFASAEVEFGGIRRRCHMACVPEAEPGDYVIVHAGIAISRVDQAAAYQALVDLRACGEEMFPGEPDVGSNKANPSLPGGSFTA
jgi:hydrogenase expression/formation protein HypC